MSPTAMRNLNEQRTTLTPMPRIRRGPADGKSSVEGPRQAPSPADLVMRARVAWRSCQDLGVWRELQTGDPLAKPMRELLEVVPALCDRLARQEESRPAPGTLGRLLSHQMAKLARDVEGYEGDGGGPGAKGEADSRPRGGSLLEKVRRLSEAALHLDVPSSRSPTTSLAGIAAMVVRDHAGDAAERGVDLQVASDVPTDRVDGVRTRLVLDHLVSNAIRHRADKGGQVRISAAGIPGRSGWWRIVVADDGPGIPVDRSRVLFEESLESSFMPDGDVDGETSGNRPLGLLISRWATEQMGGRMVLQTKPGNGTTVTFTVPTRP